MRLVVALVFAKSVLLVIFSRSTSLLALRSLAIGTGFPWSKLSRRASSCLRAILRRRPSCGSLLTTVAPQKLLSPLCLFLVFLSKTSMQAFPATRMLRRIGSLSLCGLANTISLGVCVRRVLADALLHQMYRHCCILWFLLRNFDHIA